MFRRNTLRTQFNTGKKYTATKRQLKGKFLKRSFNYEFSVRNSQLNTPDSKIAPPRTVNK